MTFKYEELFNEVMGDNRADVDVVTRDPALPGTDER